jgi:chromosome segregation ATPase
MDEDTGDSGLSGWGWFKLGEMSAERSQTMTRTASVLHDLFHPQPTIDVNALVAENQQLWQQLQALQAEAQRLEAHNAELRGANQGLYKWYEWAKGAKQTLAKHKTEVAELRSANAALQQEYDAVVKLYDDLGHDYGTRFDRISDLEELVRKLRQGES